MIAGLGLATNLRDADVAFAAPAWTTPQDVPQSAGRYPLFAAYGRAGAPSVGMYGPLVAFPGNPQAPLAVSTAIDTGGFPAPVGLRDGLTAPVAVSPGGTLLAVGGPRGPLDYFGLEGRRSRLRVGIGLLGGQLRRIPTGGIAATQALASAVNDRGDAAVVFSRCVSMSCAQRSILTTFRRRGGAFTAPLVLARRTGHPAAGVALNPHGDAIVAWIQRRTHRSGNDIRARVRRASGALTKVRTAGSTAPRPTIAVTLTRGRHGVVSWFSQAVGEGATGGPFTVSAANIDSRGTIGGPRTLDRDSTSASGDDAIPGVRLRVLLGADGVTTFAWTSFTGGHYVVRAERLQRDVGLVEALSPPDVDAHLMDLSGDREGDALVVWASGGQAATARVAAAIRPSSATLFGAPQLALPEWTPAAPPSARSNPAGRSSPEARSPPSAATPPGCA